MADLDAIFEPPLARIRIDRPERRNAMSRAMWLALADAVARDRGARRHRASCSCRARAAISAPAPTSPNSTRSSPTPAATRDYLAAIETGLTALAGSTVRRSRCSRARRSAAASRSALACDLRFAAEDAHIAAPPAKLGLLYGPVETRRLVELVGPSRAKDLLFSGRRVATEEALAIGLIDRRLPAASVHAEAEAYARDLAVLSQTSIRGAKAMIEGALAGEPDAGTRALVEAAAEGADFREGRTAFAEKRRPKFG